MDRQVRVAMVAGEASGDLLAAPLIAALKARLPGAVFFGIGGPRMQAQGFESWFDMETLAVRGYAEAARSIPANPLHQARVVRSLARRSTGPFHRRRRTGLQPRARGTPACAVAFRPFIT